MESLFLLAFGEEEFLAALAMTGFRSLFNKAVRPANLTKRQGGLFSYSLASREP